jgi:SAM-dependent methyltransferase
MTPPSTDPGDNHGVGAGDHFTGPAGHGDGDPDWNEWYGSIEQVWSGQPNVALVTEVADLLPGRAPDVGCGEGADAIWLARRGWAVTALDVSEVALQRASAAAEQAGAHVQWIRAALVDAPLDGGSFDLVSAHYVALRSTPGHEAERSLLAAVAPGGLLLVVHHADVDAERAKVHGFDPADYVGPGDVAALLGESWDVTFDERRPREVTAGAGAHHTHDVVGRARRLQ